VEFLLLEAAFWKFHIIDKFTIHTIELAEKSLHEEKHYFWTGFWNNIDGFTKSP
jgi:hypothetical protein